MGRRFEIRMPQYPECWETCGDCASGAVFVIDVHVKSGDVIRADDNLITLETGKVALDIPSPHAGRIVEVCMDIGARPAEGDLIAVIESD